MSETSKKLTEQAFRDVYRRAARIVQQHSFPMHESAAVFDAPMEGVTYQRDGVHYLITDIRATFRDILALLSDMVEPAHDELRDALLAARALIAGVSDRSDKISLSHAQVLAQLDAVLVKPAVSFAGERQHGKQSWAQTIRARFERAVSSAEAGYGDEWWHGFASGLLEALDAHVAFTKYGSGICVVSEVRHAGLWRDYRARGEPIRSAWIDELGDGAPDLLLHLKDASECGVTLFYAEKEDVIDEALMIIGASLAAGRRVLLVGAGASISLAHSHMTREADLSGAFAEAGRLLGRGSSVEPPLPDWLLNRK